MIPTREIYWNITGLSQAGMYLLLALPAFFLAYGITRRYLVWRRGKQHGPIDRIPERLRTTLAVALLHRRLLRPGQRYAGLMHLFVFWGFAVLFLGTLTVTLQADLVGPYLGRNFLKGNFYVAFKLILNLFGLLFVVGLLMALHRRYFQGLAKFKSSLADDALVLWTLLLLGLTGFLLQALRLVGTADPYGPIHWVSYPIGLALAGMDRGALQAVHLGTWWVHMAATMLFLAYLAFSKMFHLIGGPASLFVGAGAPKGALEPILDIEEQEKLGASSLEDFGWRQLLKVDACMRCARCLDYCPTYNSGKPLKPRQFIQEVAGYMARQGGIYSGLGSALPAQVGVRGQEWSGDGEATVAKLAPDAELIGDVVSAEEIWDCTTCRACMEHCPVMIEHIPLLVELRRHLVLEHSEFPPELVPVFNSLERRGNPYQASAASRADWAKGLSVPDMAGFDDPTGVEVLYWVGCTASYDPRSQKVARALVEILRSAGISFAILGKEESCCGDPARRAGNEHLYQMLAQQNIAILNGYGAKRIVTACPHCFNTLKNEYPQFGGNYEVVHHSQFLDELLQSGRLRLAATADGQEARLTYHDPCYLGRYNDEYDAPRRLLARAAGGSVEMLRTRDRSFCCGSGGGHAFMEERRGSRISHGRLKEAMATGAAGVAVACPFCLTAMEDGIRVMDARETFRAQDIAELATAALDKANAR